jgi:hypothetical protein
MITIRIMSKKTTLMADVRIKLAMGLRSASGRRLFFVSRGIRLWY